MSKSQEQLKDISDVELEQLLTSKANGLPQIPNDGGDLLSAFSDLPQPASSDLATSETAQRWAENEIVKATPRAVQEMINQLRRGSSKERMEASKQILDRAGLVGAERGHRQSPVVVIQQTVVQSLP